MELEYRAKGDRVLLEEVKVVGYYFESFELIILVISNSALLRQLLRREPRVTSMNPMKPFD